MSVEISFNIGLMMSSQLFSNFRKNTCSLTKSRRSPVIECEGDPSSMVLSPLTWAGSHRPGVHLPLSPLAPHESLSKSLEACQMVNYLTKNGVILYKC